MKILRLKITDPKGFRSLQPGFEYQFRTEWDLQEEQGFAPFVCAGPNGSGKSNLLEAMAAIFYQLEILRVRRSFLPVIFFFNEADPFTRGIKDGEGTPNAFELEYLIRPPKGARFPMSFPVRFETDLPWIHVRIIKQLNESPRIEWVNKAEFDAEGEGSFTADERDILLPDFVLGYSSGENQILSLPFFKMRFVQYDEYWQKLKDRLDYPGRPETRMAYLDNEFSQAILLCNLLFQDAESLAPFREDIGIEELKEFRIIIRRSIPLDESQLSEFDPLTEDGQSARANRIRSEYKNERSERQQERIRDEIIRAHDALETAESMFGGSSLRLNLIERLDGDEKSKNIIPRLQRCATCAYLDETTDTLYLDYFVNDAIREAFRENFSNDPLELFQAFQVLLTLNLFAVSENLKNDLYQSESHYVSETVPTVASDERIMRFKFVKFRKTDVAEPVMLKNLSDGEHQLLHTLGLCLLFKNTQSLFLLDEPETHFNPDWRANFVTRLHDSFNGSDGHEMLVTTHTPFLISDSRPEKVLVFNKADGVVSVSHPDYNTLGASINKITMTTFGKRETIGLRAQTMLDDFRTRSKDDNENKELLITEINRQLGDSVEKVLLIKTILESTEGQC
jgi:restriction system-associated AAA family ATPase